MKFLAYEKGRTTTALTELINGQPYAYISWYLCVSNELRISTPMQHRGL